MSLNIGDSVPNFQVIADNGETLSQADLKGKKTIIYFYPKDNTPGCNKEAREFTEKYPQFQQHGIDIIGVSKDSVKKHLKFKQKYNIPFPLLADEATTLCDAFGVIVDKRLFGKKYRGIERSTFYIDETGKVKAMWRKVSVFGHVKEIFNVVTQ